MKYNKFLEEIEQIDADHKKFSIETPLREDAFELSDQEKIDLIKKNKICFKIFLLTVYEIQL